ncbi:MAG: hypothetical protein AB7O97_16270 [Planctomycetota bacterium]
MNPPAENPPTQNLPDLDIRPYRAGDEHAILGTFNRVFREVCGPGYVDRTLAQWRWQYRDNPQGHRIWLAMAPDGTCAAQYAGVPLLADTPWGPQTFVHCVDSMTHPDWRQGLKRKGLFVLTCEPFWDDSKRRGDALFYGFPVDTAYRIGKRYLQYTQMCIVDFLIRDRATPPLAAPPDVVVERVDAVPAEVDALYERLRADVRCMVRRDRRYLDWRYVQNPQRADYELWTARRGGALQGLLVLRPGSGLAPDAATIVDLVVPRAETAALDALLAAAVRRQHEEQRARLMTALPGWSPEHRHLEQRGFAPTPSANWLQRRLVHNINGPPVTAAFLEREWWFTLGDSDLA